jgi:hypothetical protein
MSRLLQPSAPPSVNGLTVSFLSAADTLGDAGLRADWEKLLGHVNILNRLYASPQWFELRSKTHPDVEMWLCVMRDSAGQVVGLCPVASQPYTLKYSIGARSLARVTVRAAAILGSEPILPACQEAHRLLYRQILDQLKWAACVYLEALPFDSYGWQYLSAKERPMSDCWLHLPRGKVDTCRVAVLGESYEHFLKQMTSRTRGNLLRKVRRLRDHAAGTLECRRVTAEEDVEQFVAHATQVSLRSWQHRVLGPRTAAFGVADLKSYARAGILRCYILMCRGEPCAFEVATQFGGVYDGRETAYDEAFDALGLSPGRALLNFVIEDLFRYDKPDCFSFGKGDAAYKQDFANQAVADVSVCLFRKTFRNRLLIGSQQAFHAGVRLAKWLLRRNRPASTQGAPA